MKNIDSYYQRFIDKQSAIGNLIIQPRMGFSSSKKMREGLLAVKSLNLPTVGTITIDSFTRSRDFASAAAAIKKGESLNGYPIVTYTKEENQQLISNIRSEDFPLQVRHGSPLPKEIFIATIEVGIDAIEGGPISYCLPYSRVPISDSITAWAECSELYAEAGEGKYHIESFGGCMMGQLCPPSMLIAITILEALFFKFYSIKSISVSLSQGTNSEQDLAALKALRELCEKYLRNELDWHIVYYSFMGKFPTTFKGAKSIIEESALIAKQGGANRLIVKTVKEAVQIPTVQDNLDALKWADQIANHSSKNIEDRKVDLEIKNKIKQEVEYLLEAVLNLDNDPGKAIKKAFEKGYLDVPFCLHQSNKRESLSKIDSKGNIIWADLGNLPIPKKANTINRRSNELTSNELLTMLSFNQFKYDY